MEEASLGAAAEAAVILTGWSPGFVFEDHVTTKANRTPTRNDDHDRRKSASNTECRRASV